MAALTLAQYAQNEKQLLRKGFYLGLARFGIISDIFSWRSLGALSEEGRRLDEVNRPTWVPLGGAISSAAANTKPIVNNVFEMALHIDIPEPLHEHQGDRLQRDIQIQTKATMMGANFELNDAFINGDQAVDGNMMEGLNKLVSQLGAEQVVGATELDISAGGDQASRWNVIDRMLDAHRQVSGQKPSMGFCNDTFESKFRGILMREKLLGDHHDWLKDTFNPGDPRVNSATPATKPSFIFDGVPYWNLGVKTDQTTRIIANNYVEGGSATGATRVFLVKQGDDDLEGIQAEGLAVKEIGLLEGTDVRRWRFKWIPGLALWGPQSIVKVAGIKVA